MIKNFYYKIVGLVYIIASPWQKRKYGFYPHGKGDVIFRSLLHAIATQDIFIIHECAFLLHNKKRWPDNMNDELDHKYRSQKSMTRDPYIMYIVALSLIDYYKTGPCVKAMKIPWNLYRSYLHNWRRFMITNDDIYLVRFERQIISLISWGKATQKIANFFHNRTWFIRGLRHKFGIHSYSIHLWAWMAYVTDSYALKKELLKITPRCNDLVRMLCGDNDPEFIEVAKRFKERTGYQWTEDHILVEKEIIDPSSGIKISKDILDWLIKNIEK